MPSEEGYDLIDLTREICDIESVSGNETTLADARSDRVVLANESFVVAVPFAARWPFEVAVRARRHGLVAAFFESVTGASGEAMGAIARHWRDAGDNERAVRQLVRAAEQAERGWAKDHAALLYREALQLTAADNAEGRSMLLRRLADRELGVLPRARRQAPGKSAGVTSPAISSIQSIWCCPSRVECARTISSLGAE